MRELIARIERWETARPFVIARGAKHHVDVVVAEIRDGALLGRGEGTPIYYKGDTPELALAALQAMAGAIADGTGRVQLLDLMPPGAARNALDSALWDLEAKQAGKRLWELAGLPAPKPLLTAYTISLGEPGEMADAAREASGRELLKLKLGGEGDVERIAAVRSAAPDVRLIADANESWNNIDIEKICSEILPYRVELVEQPLPAGRDGDLRHLSPAIPLAADESLQSRAELGEVVGRYRFINVKLDKCGGLTEALALSHAARLRGLGQLTGCMLSTSLGVAPAFVAASQGHYADLDGPLLLARDRPHGLCFHGSDVDPPEVALWG
ncbi:dipeptide epimerase [Sandaracinobacter sp. RS1-74]|uniref:N-acetyl-D-Glu racemase DgcA n=1 Tax=Sandaracinobacteroides sayramensis TaxID=2913411 RepID=UPI001EDBAB80|nr:N-acetyl-D-Glu racemase DgcA [Sandaracinobacteroides sayramensis]MCG2839964.1 dipeptide epimerase [Sandaracinobacteroides sayramensis]